MRICIEHNKEFKLRDGKSGPFYSHVLSGTKETGFTYHNSDMDKIVEVSREADSIQTPAPIAPIVPTPPPTPSYTDDRSKRIERQHSQEMALRYLDLVQRTDVATPIDLAAVKKLTDHFVKDLDS